MDICIVVEFFLFQDSVLFHDTIFYNLQYGNPRASREEVRFIIIIRCISLHRRFQHDECFVSFEIGISEFHNGRSVFQKERRI